MGEGEDNDPCDENDERENIAVNMALKENIFMMIVCIQNRIPLFLIGKPGSSKSLAKSMVTNALRGKKSNSGLFKHMKRVSNKFYFYCSCQ